MLRSSVALVLALLPSPLLAEPVGADSLRELGWTPVDAPADTAADCPVQAPSLARLQGMGIWVRDNADFPRPVARCRGRAVPLPLAGEAAFLRTEPAAKGGGDGTVSWGVRAAVTDLGGGTVLLDLDVPPLKEPNPELGRPNEAGLATGPLFGLASGGEAPPATAVGVGGPRGGSSAALRRLLDGLRSPVLSTDVLTELKQDGQFASLDGGASWLTLVLAPTTRQSGTHELSGRDLRAMTLEGDPALVVAPRPLNRAGALELFAVTQARHGGPPVLRPLGRPSPRAAAWRQQLGDVRALAGGRLEALVLVHDITAGRGKADAPGEPWTESWGCLMSRAPDGEWSEVERFALPDGIIAPDVRFAPGRERTAVLTSQGHEVARLRLRS